MTEFVKGKFETEEEIIIYKQSLDQKIKKFQGELDRQQLNIELMSNTKLNVNSELNLDFESSFDDQKSKMNLQNDCGYHRSKITKLIQDLNDQIEINLRIKEANMKLKLFNETLGMKLESKDQLLKQHIAGTYLNKNENIEDLSKIVLSPQKVNSNVYSNLNKRNSRMFTFQREQKSSIGLGEKMPDEQDIALRNNVEICQRLIQAAENHSTIDKLLIDVQRDIEQIYGVEKCIILKLLGKDFTDGREYKFASDDGFFEDLVEEQKPIIVNDISKDKNLQRELKTQVIAAICMLNKLDFSDAKSMKGAPEQDNKKQQQEKQNDKQLATITSDNLHFGLNDCPAASPLFLSILNHLFFHQMNKEHDEERRVLTMVDSILQFPNMRLFIETVENQFQQIFECERANLVLVDRFKKDLFKYTHNEHTNEDNLQTYHLDRGIAGYVAISGHSLYVQNIDEDSKFNNEIDDPKGIYYKYEVGSDSLANLPRGVIQLINRSDPNGFDNHDMEKLEFLSNIVGRCHDSVLKIEQLYCLKSVSENLSDITKKIQTGLDTSCIQYGHMKKQFTQFMQSIKDRQNSNPMMQLNQQQQQSIKNLASPSTGKLNDQKSQSNLHKKQTSNVWND
ncbi:UNKNOWN [Stylonychia lemnae]|uniref:GAF domain-containing protein n=1 Tax=Stylonychia lemnae TaxID=5949 RepID=A0A077ZU68_STYLE|nr:UNKNOWN [Stylonychia lemnae]|eukprot:CDW73453.1 UNKNOWN [Stylonychia lemnae]